MSIATVMPYVFPQFLDDDGIPVSGGKLYTYIAGTSTPQSLYTDSALLIPYSNPLILDISGRPPGPVFCLVSPAYKYLVTDANDVTVVGPYDFIIASAPSA